MVVAVVVGMYGMAHDEDPRRRGDALPHFHTSIDLDEVCELTGLSFPPSARLLNGRYYWVPFHRIRQIVIEPPEDLRDHVWLPVQFTWANGGQAVGLVPTRYAGSESSEDPRIRLARRTEWVDRGSEVYTGLGQRTLATDAGEYALLDVRRIELDTPGAGEAADG